jgi:hypothetical protein
MFTKMSSSTHFYSIFPILWISISVNAQTSPPNLSPKSNVEINSSIIESGEGIPFKIKLLSDRVELDQTAFRIGEKRSLGNILITTFEFELRARESRSLSNFLRMINHESMIAVVTGLDIKFQNTSSFNPIQIRLKANFIHTLQGITVVQEGSPVESIIRTTTDRQQQYFLTWEKILDCIPESASIQKFNFTNDHYVISGTATSPTSVNAFVSDLNNKIMKKSIVPLVANSSQGFAFSLEFDRINIKPLSNGASEFKNDRSRNKSSVPKVTATTNSTGVERYIDPFRSNQPEMIEMAKLQRKHEIERQQQASELRLVEQKLAKQGTDVGRVITSSRDSKADLQGVAGATTSNYESAAVEKLTPPIYPLRAIQMRWQLDIKHIVRLKMFVSEEGLPLKASVVEGVPGAYGFDEAAIEAVNKSIYRPAIRDGKLVRGWTNIIEVVFPIIK